MTTPHSSGKSLVTKRSKGGGAGCDMAICDMADLGGPVILARAAGRSRRGLPSVGII
jgi:hypothetical protein